MTLQIQFYCREIQLIVDPGSSVRWYQNRASKLKDYCTFRIEHRSFERGTKRGTKQGTRVHPGSRENDSAATEQNEWSVPERREAERRITRSEVVESLAAGVHERAGNSKAAIFSRPRLLSPAHP